MDSDEMILESLLGGVGGGLLRLAPEVLKFFDRKGERSHELALGEQNLKLVEIQGHLKMQEVNAQVDIAALTALSDAYKQQAAADSNAHKWAATVSSLVRPLVTFGIVGIYAAIKLGDGYWSWNDSDQALLSMVLGFWFVSRSIAR